MKLAKLLLPALACVAGALPAAAWADGWFSRMGDPKEVTLTDLLRAPRDYVDVEVKFKVYFDAIGDNFNPYFTRFHEDMWGNFSAWPIDALLYDKRDYQRPYPFFFASKADKKAWKRVQEIERLEVLQITGAVRDIFKGQAWIEVLSWSRTGGGLSRDEIREAIAGDAQFVAGRYKEAARRYERACGSGLPPNVRADLQRRLGDAYFRAGRYADARNAYTTALRYAPESEALKQGAAASAAAHERARAARKGKTVAGEAPEPASTTEPVVQANGVDEVIRLLEDPAKVAAEVEAWRLELEKRAAALRRDAEPATPVAGTESAPPDDGATPVAGTEPAPADADGETGEAGERGALAEPDAGCAESAAEPADAGCAEEPADAGCAEESAGEPGGGCTDTACGATCDAGCGEPDLEETVRDEQRVVWVGGQMVPLPRLPFFGCEDVTDDDLRAIIEEIVRNPETDEE